MSSITLELPDQLIEAVADEAGNLAISSEELIASVLLDKFSIKPLYKSPYLNLTDRIPYRIVSGSQWDEQASKHNLAIKWIEEHRQDYIGKWVCLDGDQLISFGDDPKKVFAEAKEKGIKTPFIEKIKPLEETPFWGGWD